MGMTPLLEKMIYWWQPGCPHLGQGGAEAGWKPHYPVEEFPHRRELEKHLLEAARLLPSPVPLSVNLENLICFSITKGEKRGEKKKRREKQRRDREAVQGMGQGAGCPAGSRQSMSAAQTEKQRGSSHVPVENQRGRSRCAKGQIPHPNDKSQEVAKPPLQEPPRYRDEVAGKDDEVQSDGDPHTPQLICAEKLIPKPSLPSTLLYFRLFGGGYSPPFFSARLVCFLCFKLHRHCTTLSSVSLTRDLASTGDSTAMTRGLWLPSHSHPCLLHMLHS